MKWNSFLILVLCFSFSACQKVKTIEAISRPNILFVIGDDISFPHMGAYGCTWVNTPAFDRVASKGLLFNNAYTPNAKCAPSRAIILTGRNSWQLEEAANHVPFFPKKFKTIWETLQEQGYYTGHVAKGYAPGNPGIKNGKKRELVGPAYNELKLTPPTKAISNYDYAANFKAFLNQRNPDQPFCFWYGSLEPHRAYEFKTGEKLGKKKLSDLDSVFQFFPDEDSIRHDILDYAFEIEHFDRHLDLMLAHLEDNGLLDNTIVIVTADNGMPFPRVKGQAYERSNHLPLAIMWGNSITNPGRAIEEYVSFADFAPTLLDLAGVDFAASGMQTFEGNSLKAVLLDQPRTTIRDHILIGKERHDIGRPDDQGYPIRGIVKGDYLYLLNFKPDRWPSGNPETGYLNCDASPSKSVILHQRRFKNEGFFWDLSFGKRPPEELYNINTDPDCTLNLAQIKAYNQVKATLKATLLDELTEQQDPRVLGNGDLFDQYLYAGERHRDFYNRFMKGEMSREAAGWVIPDDFEQDSLFLLR